MTQIFIVRRTAQHEDDHKTVDCLFAFRSHDDALLAAKLSSDLTWKHYYGRNNDSCSEAISCFDQPAWHCQIENNAFVFSPFAMEVTESAAAHVQTGELYAIVLDDCVKSIHPAFELAQRHMQKFIDEIVSESATQVKSKYSPFVETFHGDVLDVHNNEDCIEVWTAKNPDREEYFRYYGEAGMDMDEDWHSTRLFNVRVAALPVGSWSTNEIQTGEFVRYWTHFLDENSSFDSFSDARVNTSDILAPLLITEFMNDSPSFDSFLTDLVVNLSDISGMVLNMDE